VKEIKCAEKQIEKLLSRFLTGSGFFICCKKISDRKIRILRIDFTGFTWQYAKH